MAVLDQHIKFFEGNYSVTAAVSCKRQTWGHYEAVNGKGRRGGSQGNLAILNILRHIIIVWFGEGKKMDRSGAGWVHACVTGQHHVCLIITPQSSLASLFLPLSSVRLSRSLVKASVVNKAHSHAERMWGSTNSHHNYIWFLPYCLSHRLYPSNSSLSHSLPKTLPTTFFSPLCIMCPRVYTHISVAHHLSLSCGGQLEPYVSHFAHGPSV